VGDYVTDRAIVTAVMLSEAAERIADERIADERIADEPDDAKVAEYHPA
jgi:hypothetical protein